MLRLKVNAAVLAPEDHGLNCVSPLLIKHYHYYKKKKKFKTTNYQHSHASLNDREMHC